MAWNKEDRPVLEKRKVCGPYPASLTIYSIKDCGRARTFLRKGMRRTGWLRAEQTGRGKVPDGFEELAWTRTAGQRDCG